MASPELNGWLPAQETREEKKKRLARNEEKRVQNAEAKEELKKLLVYAKEQLAQYKRLGWHGFGDKEKAKVEKLRAQGVNMTELNSVLKSIQEVDEERNSIRRRGEEERREANARWAAAEAELVAKRVAAEKEEKDAYAELLRLYGNKSILGINISATSRAYPRSPLIDIYRYLIDRKTTRNTRSQPATPAPAMGPLPSIRVYPMLGVPVTASSAEIKAAYRKKALEVHPNRGGNTAVFQKLGNEYEKALKIAEEREAVRGGKRTRKIKRGNRKTQKRRH